MLSNTDCCPKMTKVKFYDDKSLWETDFNNKKNCELENNLVQVFGEVSTNSLSAIVGPFGSGKSTIAMQLAVSDCCDNAIFCLFLKFANMNHETNITFQQLVVSFQNPDLSDKDCDVAFDWIKKNQSRVLIVLDACDEANWWSKMNSPAQKCNYYTPAPIWQLVGNLLNGSFLRDCHKVFTSRYSSMLELHHSFRPKVCYLVNSLSDLGIQQYVWSKYPDRADSILRKMLQCGNELISIGGNPSYLQFILSNLDKYPTLTAWMGGIVDEMCSSSHLRSIDLSDKMDQVKKLAFLVQKSSFCWFTVEILAELGLVMAAVQDFTVAFPGTKRHHSTTLKKNIKMSFFNTHLMDFLTACHVTGLEDVEFKTWLNETQFAHVFRFIAGLLFPKGNILYINFKK